MLRRAMEIIDKEREKRSQELIVREKMETVVPIIENGLIQSLLFREYFEDDIDNFKNLLGITEKYGYMAVLVFGEEQQGNHMTNAVGASIRVQNSYKEIREITRGYLPCIMGSVMANKIAMLIPCKESKMDYNERIAIIEKARELARKLKARFEVSFRVGIGSVKPQNQSIESYNEALNALIYTNGKVAHVDDMPIGCEYEENYPVDSEKVLFELTEKGNVNGAVAEANHYFDWMEENYSQFPMEIKLKCLEFVLWAEHIAYESGGPTASGTDRIICRH